MAIDLQRILQKVPVLISERGEVNIEVERERSNRISLSHRHVPMHVDVHTHAYTLPWHDKQTYIGHVTKHPC